VHVANGQIRFEIFPEMAIEFLRIYLEPLLSSLKSCGAKLTKNALKEATAVLAMIPELYKRDIREVYENLNKRVLDEYLVCAKLVVATLSKFLGANWKLETLKNSSWQSTSMRQPIEMGLIIMRHHHLREIDYCITDLRRSSTRLLSSATMLLVE
jgi:hypothetical protein